MAFHYRNEPKSARTPVRLPPTVRGGSKVSSETIPTASSGSKYAVSDTDEYIAFSVNTTPVGMPSGLAPSALATPSANEMSSKIPGSSKKTRSKSKAVLEAEQKQAELQNYAQELFEDLNEVVFENRLPTTDLKWSKVSYVLRSKWPLTFLQTLRTTAGKANWHRWVFLRLQLVPPVSDLLPETEMVSIHVK